MKMNLKQLEQRYTPGRRENSFFVDMPYVKNKRKKEPVGSNSVIEYTYYVDSDGNLIKEVLR